MTSGLIGLENENISRCKVRFCFRDVSRARLPLPPSPPNFRTAYFGVGIMRWNLASDLARREGVWLHRHYAVDALALGGGMHKKTIDPKIVVLTWDTEQNTM